MAGKSSKQRGIAATLQYYVLPLIDSAGKKAGIKHLREACRLGSIIWNEVVVAKNLGIEEQIPEMVAIDLAKKFHKVSVKQMVERKKELFGDDMRLMGECVVKKTPDGSGIRVMVREGELVEPSEVSKEIAQALSKSPNLKIMGVF